MQSESFCLLLSHLTGLDLASSVIRFKNGTPQDCNDTIAARPNDTTGKQDHASEEDDQGRSVHDGEVEETETLEEVTEGDGDVEGEDDDGMNGGCEGTAWHAARSSEAAVPNHESQSEASGTEKRYSGKQSAAAVTLKDGESPEPLVVDHSISAGAADCVSDQEDLASSPAAICHCELQRWQPGDYTLANDTGSSSSSSTGEGFTLDSRIFFCTEGTYVHRHSYTVEHSSVL